MRLVRNYIRKIVVEVLAEREPSYSDGLTAAERTTARILAAKAEGRRADAVARALQAQVDAAADQATVVYDASARRKDGPKGDLRMLGATPKSPPTPKSQPGRKRRG